MPELTGRELDRAWGQFLRREAFRERREADRAADGIPPEPVADDDQVERTGDDKDDSDLLCGFIPAPTILPRPARRIAKAGLKTRTAPAREWPRGTGALQRRLNPRGGDTRDDD